MVHSNVCCIPKSSQEWVPQQIYPKLRPSMLWETAKNSRTPPQTLQVHSKHLRPTVSMVVERWRFGHLTVTEQNMNCSVYQSVLESSVKPSVWQLKHEWKWVINRTIIPSTAAEKGKNQCCGPKSRPQPDGNGVMTKQNRKKTSRVFEAKGNGKAQLFSQCSYWLVKLFTQIYALTICVFMTLLITADPCLQCSVVKKGG